MAAQLYAETQIAECLYEVLSELIEEGAIEEPLAVATLNQLSEVRVCHAMSDPGHAPPPGPWRPVLPVAADPAPGNPLGCAPLRFHPSHVQYAAPVRSPSWAR